MQMFQGRAVYPATDYDDSSTTWAKTYVDSQLALEFAGPKDPWVIVDEG